MKFVFLFIIFFIFNHDIFSILVQNDAIFVIDKQFGEILRDKQLLEITRNGNDADGGGDTDDNDRNHDIEWKIAALKTFNNQKYRKKCLNVPEISEKNHNNQNNICAYLSMIKNLLENSIKPETESFPEEQILQNKKRELLKKYKKLQISHNNQIFVGENNVEELLSRTEDPVELELIWRKWNHELQSLEGLFKQIIQIYNSLNLDPTINWNKDLNIQEPENELEFAEKLWSKVEHFYKLLEIYVKDNLKNVFDLDPKLNSIPVHLLKTFSAVQFDEIFEIIKPYPDISDPGTEQEFSQNLDMKKIFFNQISEIFGEKFTKRIVNNSKLDILVGQNVSCHPLSFDMFDNNSMNYSSYMRICLNSLTSKTNNRKIIHELGHILYFNSYRNQANLVKLLLPNSAIHESIGETFLLLQNRCKILGQNHKIQINSLLKEALTTFTRLPFALSLEQWRKNLFRNRENDINLTNFQYWNLRSRIQNIIPVEYSGLQALSKFHVINFMPYLRYYFSIFISHQFYETFCGSSSRCCLNSTIVDRFDGFLSSDLQDFNSNWQILTGKTWKYDPEPLLRYYSPLIEWLENYSNQREKMF